MIELSENISITEVDQELIILDLSSGAFYGLNHIGRELVLGFQHGRDAKATVSHISHKYNVDSDLVENDIEDLVKELLSVGILIDS